MGPADVVEVTAAAGHGAEPSLKRYTLDPRDVGIPRCEVRRRAAVAAGGCGAGTGRCIGTVGAGAVGPSRRVVAAAAPPGGGPQGRRRRAQRSHPTRCARGRPGCAFGLGHGIGASGGVCREVAQLRAQRNLWRRPVELKRRLEHCGDGRCSWGSLNCVSDASMRRRCSRRAGAQCGLRAGGCTGGATCGAVLRPGGVGWVDAGSHHPRGSGSPASSTACSCARKRVLPSVCGHR
jgi:hypothetical protein